MKRRHFFGGVLVGALFSGCALYPVVLVGTGVLGGVAISEDTVKSEVDVDYDRVWNAVLNEMEKSGDVILKDKIHGTVEGKVQSSEIHITVERITPKTVRFKVKSRKHFLPNIKLAHELSTRIMRQL